MMEWISVEDRLPESKYRLVIIWVKRLYAPNYMNISTYRDGEWSTLDGCSDILEFVTHWMPLPEPPEQP